MFFHRDLLLVGRLVRVASLPLLLDLGGIWVSELAWLLDLDGVNLLSEGGDALLVLGGDVDGFIVLDERQKLVSGIWGDLTRQLSFELLLGCLNGGVIHGVICRGESLLKIGLEVLGHLKPRGIFVGVLTKVVGVTEGS